MHHTPARLTVSALLFAAAFALPARGTAMPDKPAPSRIDFSYSFATPHRVTLGRPDASDRTLVDLQPGSVRLAWSHDDLRGYPPAAFKTPPTQWSFTITPQVAGHGFARHAWTRCEGWLPSVVTTFDDAEGRATLELMGGIKAAAGRLTLENPTDRPQRFVVRCESGSWGENPGWTEPAVTGADHIIAGWNERADRLLLLGLGAQANSDRPDGRSPGAKTLLMIWDVPAHGKASGWIVRPYLGFSAEMPAPRTADWAADMEAGKREWRELIGRAAQVSVPDPGVVNGYKACLADLFIMREPAAGGHIAAVPGTEVYRAANTHEAAISAITLDQLGLHKEAERGYRLPLALQEPDGNWDDNRGWGHSMWSCSGFKSWFIMTHYRLTRDRKHLAGVYPRMLAASRWREVQRARSRVMEAGKKPLTYGLMPRGFGDCGLYSDDDMYGVFTPHNIWAVYADGMAAEAARILGHTVEAAELERIYQAGKADLLDAMDRGAITEGDRRWISGVAGKTSGSLWGSLNALTPCELLPADHPLIDGTLAHMEARLSPGGIPIHTGWLADGMWVAITLDNLAEAHLRRGNGDAAARYFRATLNHGTPLYTWCEERGQEPGTTTCTGDRQHLWTPIAVARALRDMLVMEQPDGLHLGLGADREWLGSGGPLGITGGASEYGPVSWTLRYDAAAGKVTGEVKLSPKRKPGSLTVHVRLPDGLRVTGGDLSGGRAAPSGEALTWENPKATLRFEATVGRP
jgi:hypothetical protein